MAETTSPDVSSASPELAPCDSAEQSTSNELAPDAGTSRAELRRQRARRRWLTLIVPPFVAFLFADLLLYVAATMDGATQDFFSPSHWSRFDSAIYVQIATHGYTFIHCSGPPLYPPHSWCGTASCATLNPGLMASCGQLGLPLPWPGCCCR